MSTASAPGTLDVVVFETVRTPDGPFSLLADERGAVVASGWTADAEALVARLRPADRAAAVRSGGTDDAADAVRAYYDGDVRAIDAVSVRQTGTDGQLAGWAALREIAPGAPLTYAQFAAAFSQPSAVRAAASVCARNAAALFVPCHRVLRSDGSMGGFAWGVDIKRSLLDREAAAA